MENLPVMIRLNVGQVNRLLNLLGTHPYNVAADLIHVIKGQGDMQIAAAQADQARAAGAGLQQNQQVGGDAAVDPNATPANVN